MSGSKCSAPADCSPGGGAVGAVVAIPLVVAGLAAVGVAKGIQAGYRHIKKTRAETSKTMDELILTEMNQQSSSICPESLSNVEVKGVNLDRVFSHLETYHSENYNSGLYVNDYSGDTAHARTFVVGQAGSSEKDPKIAFVKDEYGRYYAFGNTSSANDLSQQVYNMVSTFYRSELNYRLHEWGFIDIKVEDTAKEHKLTAKNKDGQSVIARVNRENGQVIFERIPVSIRDRVKDWLIEFTGECKVIDSGGGNAIISSEEGTRIR